MNNERRTTTGQPSGLTRKQWVLISLGALSCIGAAAIAILVNAALGLALIGMVGYCIGYFCSTPKRLEFVKANFEHFSSGLIPIALILFVLSVPMVINHIYRPGSLDATLAKLYPIMIGAYLLGWAVVLGQLVRVRGSSQTEPT